MLKINKEEFSNIDVWVNKVILKQYEKDVLSKLLREKNKEGEEKKADHVDPFPIIGGGVGGGYRPPPH